MRILSFLKSSKAAVLLIFVLLIIQAFCDLSLPAYTSDIVDIGIQQSGIDGAAPTQIRAETLSDLELFMSDEDISTVESAYALNDNNIYELTSDKAASIDELDEIFGMPEALLSQMETMSGMRIDDVKAAISSGTMTKEQLVSSAESKLTSLSDSMIQQMAAVFVKDEYLAIGLDVDQMQTDYLLTTGAKMLGLTFLMITVAIMAGFMASRTAAGIGRDMRASLFSRVLSFSSREIDRFSTASLITRSTNDIQQVQMVLVMLLRMVLYAPILGIGGIIRVMSTHTGMSWIIGVAVGTILVLIIILMRIAMPKFKKMQVLIDKLNLVSREILTGIPVIRAFSRERHEEKRFDVASYNLMRTQLFTNRVMAFMMPTMMLIMNIITLMIVWFGAQGVDLGNLQVGDMMAFITYTIQIIMSFMILSMVSIMLPRGNVAAERIYEVVSTVPSISDKPVVADDSLSGDGFVEFNDVSFKFPGADANVLDHISFQARPGLTTAVIGSTGSGKSTLVHLIPRFYDVTEGSVTIDGVDIRDLSQKKLHGLLGYVPQKGVLFSGDIESNLKFGGSDISDETMISAARIAQAEEFIDQKPEKYARRISQGGTNISGGQKQRLSIARAIANNPRIYIFDDSFSALDYKTDVALRRAMREQVQDATVIIVAQRIATILHADQIIVLDEGRIKGIGTHKELLERCQTYREIAQSQLSEEELGMKGGDDHA